MTNKTRAKGRVARKSLRNKGPLFSEARKGYVQRWCNLQGSNYENLLELGYSPRKKEETHSDEKPVGDDQFATAVIKTVSRDGLKAVLMEIPEDIFEEIQREKAGEIQELNAALRPVESETSYGSMETKITK